jgi:hypothetical protein
MRSSICSVVFVLLAFLLPASSLLATPPVSSLPTSGSGNSASAQGTVLDASGAILPNTPITLHNALSGASRTATTDSAGKFSITNLAFGNYRITVHVVGFKTFSQLLELNSVVPVTLQINLKVAAVTDTIVVEDAGDMLETDSSFHTDVDRSLIDKMPMESVSSSVSSLVTQATPGVSADSNGLFHGLGDHASNSFSVDGQAMTDQQSKVFSNQIPMDSIQSLEVISGAPPAEFGDKTSLVIKVTTRSGLGTKQPTGSITSSYGSFGSSNLAGNLSLGSDNWGNFVSLGGLNTSRFLDPPEFKAFHDRGNEQNFFDRVDFRLNKKDTVQLNLGYTRSWFQTPNSYDNLHLFGETDNFGNPLPETDQRSKIGTFNIAPTYTHLINDNSVWNLGAFIRKDQYNYYASKDPFADLGAPNLQQETIAQSRNLANLGLRTDVSYNKGIHNAKAGITYTQTLLNEGFGLGIVDPTLNAPCLTLSGSPVTTAGINDPSECAIHGYSVNPNFIPLLGCNDLTRPTPSIHDGCALTVSTIFPFKGHTDIKQLAAYVEDVITKGNWNFNIGARAETYSGYADKFEFQPRVGLSYNLKRTHTVLRTSYARTLETPFNENLILSDTGCSYPVIAALIPCVPAKFGPGFRNEFHAGFEQTLGRHFIVSGDYIWKYTHGAYDFSVLGATPITFPIEWHNAKIPGFALNARMPEWHRFSALVVMSSVAARFFTPQVAGLGVTVGQTPGPFRIDHDEKFNQSTHLQYQLGKRGPWTGMNWRYDSGQVAGSVPYATSSNPTSPGYTVNLTGLTADQQMQSGLRCGTLAPTLSSPLTSCPANLYHSSMVVIPSAGTENDDHNPPRIASRNLFDVSVGQDNLFQAQRYKVNLTLTAINVTNKYSLYNFLSTFSGTHFVTPRSLTAELAFNF